MSHLLAEGRDVRVLDRNPCPLAVPLVRGDLRDRDVLRRALDGTTTVFHLAAHTGARRSVEEAAETVSTNVGGTALLAEEAQRVGVQTLVLASSAAVFGECRDAVAGSTPRRPTSPYGASKLGAEGLVEALAATSDLRTAVARLVSVYGPHANDHQVVHRFVRRAQRGRPLTWFGDGTARRDHLHVDDAVRALLIAESTAQEGHPSVVHGATGRATSLRELTDLLQRLAGRHLDVDVQHPQPGDPHTCLLRPTCFEATIALEEGVERLWQAG